MKMKIICVFCFFISSRSCPKRQWNERTEDMESERPRCASIKSKKHPDQRCPNQPKDGTQWCAWHSKSQTLFVAPTSGSASPTATMMTITVTPKGKRRVSTSPIVVRSPKLSVKKKREAAAQTIQRCWILKGRTSLRKLQGPATFCTDLAHNDKDISTYDSVSTIPLAYRFSYIDVKHHLWLFDIRFLVNLMQYGNELKNPFTQEDIDTQTLIRMQSRTEQLRVMKKPIVYVEEESLTPEQIWNQKVLDVFLKLTSLGFGVNVLWFETLTVRGHELFYTRLYSLWNLQLRLTEEEKERIVPGHSSGRSPLFRWHPSAVTGRGFELKWWRKQNLQLMRAFLQRSDEKETQGCGALYILTALANTHRRCAESFPWLVQEED